MAPNGLRKGRISQPPDNRARPLFSRYGLQFRLVVMMVFLNGTHQQIGEECDDEQSG
ncbi:hypothetical protein SAMN05421772_1161, partial [Paracoccus saliphilus]